ncbi:zinc finger protein 501-like [Chrysoperla carnea]|uniref:zinc finger protein 501-like n=1 Tax=Chrysoperla carnea TaxID=189513 RepID=UPI001D081A5F|nr:zinc finger protein 501-like [Chrysoperla carnea]
MDTCLMDDFDKICRICMKFDKTFLSITSFKIIDMIIACASVQIWENDDLPNQICHACFLQLQNTISFKQLCENSDNSFRQIIQRNKINLSNNQIDFDIVKDEQFEDYADDNSVMDTKDFHENVKNENTLESEINSHNEDNSKESDRPKSNKNQIRTKSEQQRVTRENIKDDDVIKPFTCDKCNKAFQKVWILGQHMHRKHRAKALKCSECELKLYHPLHLKEHQELIHNQSNLTCDVCNKVLKDIYKLKRHKLTHLSASLHCQQCDKTFKDKFRLKSHNKEVHSATEKYAACHICGKSITKRALRQHLRTHNEREKLTCQHCSKPFKNEITLKAHVKDIHGDQKPVRKHLCNICGHASRAPATLRKHLLIHTDARPHPCNRCDKAFRTKEDLKKHLNCVHLNIRRYQCTFCPKAFCDKKVLVHHERLHTGEKPYKCEVCDKAFAQRIAWKIHMKTHSNSREKFSQSLGESMVISALKTSACKLQTFYSV